MDSKGPDQTARLCSLIWTFAVPMCRGDVFAWCTGVMISSVMISMDVININKS